MWGGRDGPMLLATGGFAGNPHSQEARMTDHGSTIRRSAGGALRALAVAAALAAAGAAPAAADIELLPDAACNDGARNAHMSVPHENPALDVNPGHRHLPRAPGGVCQHTTSP